MILSTFISYLEIINGIVEIFMFQDPLEFMAKELRKHFNVGDHIKVIAGRHESETGLIVRIENNLAIVFSDLTMHEVFTSYSLLNNILIW